MTTPRQEWRTAAIEYWNAQAKPRTLYRFHWSHKAETGVDIGWWTGREWSCLFGDGGYSPELVAEIEELLIAAPVDLGDGR